jgi:hypothetical protein
VTGERLCKRRRNARPLQVRDDRMPKRGKVGEQPLAVLVAKEVRLFAPRPFVVGLRLPINYRTLRRRGARVGHIVEWHLDFHNAFRHQAFHFVARPRQPAVVIAPPFLDTGFEAVWSIRHPMRRNGSQ